MATSAGQFEPHKQHISLTWPSEFGGKIFARCRLDTNPREIKTPKSLLEMVFDK